MRRDGIINSRLQFHLSRLRHTDLFCISDSGLPSPRGVPLVDLALTYGLPGFLPTLTAVLDTVVTEGAYASEDVVAANKPVHEHLTSLPGLELIDHASFKAKVAECAFVVRTGEATPFANVILRAGVPWL